MAATRATVCARILKRQGAAGITDPWDVGNPANVNRLISTSYDYSVAEARAYVNAYLVTGRFLDDQAWAGEEPVVGAWPTICDGTEATSCTTWAALDTLISAYTRAKDVLAIWAPTTAYTNTATGSPMDTAEEAEDNIEALWATGQVAGLGQIAKCINHNNYPDPTKYQLQFSQSGNAIARVTSLLSDGTKTVEIYAKLGSKAANGGVYNVFNENLPGEGYAHKFSQFTVANGVTSGSAASYLLADSIDASTYSWPGVNGKDGYFLHEITIITEWDFGDDTAEPDAGDIPADVYHGYIVISRQAGRDRAYMAQRSITGALSWLEITPTFPVSPEDAQEYEDTTHGVSWTYVDHETNWVGRVTGRVVNKAVTSFDDAVPFTTAASSMWYEWPEWVDDDVQWNLLCTPSWQTSYWIPTTSTSRVGCVIQVGTAAPYGGTMYIRAVRRYGT